MKFLPRVLLVAIAVLPNSSLGFPSTPSTAILITRHPSSTTTTTRLFWASNDNRATVIARNNARTCVKTFLTQRAIQSFMFLLEECRDPHSGKWIEDFLGLQNMLNYHGTGAFDINRFKSWDKILLEMMARPKGEEQCSVSALSVVGVCCGSIYP